MHSLFLLECILLLIIRICIINLQWCQKIFMFMKQFKTDRVRITGWVYYPLQAQHQWMWMKKLRQSGSVSWCISHLVYRVLKHVVAGSSTIKSLSLHFQGLSDVARIVGSTFHMSLHLFKDLCWLTNSVSFFTFKNMCTFVANEQGTMAELSKSPADRRCWWLLMLTSGYNQHHGRSKAMFIWPLWDGFVFCLLVQIHLNVTYNSSRNNHLMLVMLL